MARMATSHSHVILRQSCPGQPRGSPLPQVRHTMDKRQNNADDKSSMGRHTHIHSIHGTALFVASHNYAQPRLVALHHHQIKTISRPPESVSHQHLPLFARFARTPTSPLCSYTHSHNFRVRRRAHKSIRELVGKRANANT